MSQSREKKQRGYSRTGVGPEISSSCGEARERFLFPRRTRISAGCSSPSYSYSSLGDTPVPLTLLMVDVQIKCGAASPSRNGTIIIQHVTEIRSYEGCRNSCAPLSSYDIIWLRRGVQIIYKCRKRRYFAFIPCHFRFHRGNPSMVCAVILISLWHCLEGHQNVKIKLGPFDFGCRIVSDQLQFLFRLTFFQSTASSMEITPPRS